MDSFERIRVLFCDHLGLTRGKYVPTWHAKSGEARFCVSLFGQTYNKDLIPAPGAQLLQGLPDFQANFNLSEARTSWEDKTRVVVADLESKGEVLSLCGRGLLKKSIKEWEAKGLKAQVGVELEAYIMQRDADGNWVPYDTPGAFTYGTGSSVDPAGLIDEIWHQAEVCGYPVEAINSEFDSPQFEFTMKYADALTAIDNVFLFKVMSKELVQKRGYLLTFMPKPLSDKGGNGFHINFSFLDQNGKNVINGPSEEESVSDLGKQCIAGLLKHHRALTAILAPTVNSYRRLQPANLAGYWANWGYDHRGVTVRVPGERGVGSRIEHRLADATSNPYVATAAVLQAAKLGVENNYELPPAETGDCFEDVNTDVCVPKNLESALDALEADTDFIQSLNEELIANFVCVKRKEWENYMAHTSDWEISTYMNLV